MKTDVVAPAIVVSLAEADVRLAAPAIAEEAAADPAAD